MSSAPSALPSSPQPHLAVALDGAGRHPSARREPVARSREPFTAEYWADLVILIPYNTPGGLDVLVDTELPPLRERGVFRTEYEGATLRDHLGLADPDARARARARAHAHGVAAADDDARSAQVTS
ncbi:hypothetical protein [Streptomyces umbrinus]|uniref:hypothetical protein n=1 Tax=Streptomyces umbrinus TaxID=67370 RepID=UPI003F4D1164